jgi:DNA polymerase
MDTLALDYETYYDKGYSLSKIPMQNYIHHPEFEIIGVSVKHNDSPTQWFSGTLCETKAWLSHFPWEESIAIAHNAQFDGAILEQVLDIHPAKYFCTMMGARPNVVPFVKNGRMGLKYVAEYLGLPPKGDEVINAIGMRRRDFARQQLSAYAEYCIRDTDLTYLIYHRLKANLPPDEQDILDLTIKKVTRPTIVLNKEKIAHELNKHNDDMAHLMDKAMLVTGITNFRQNQPFAEFLMSRGVTPGMKISPTTNKEVYAFAKTDPFMKQLAEHEDYAVQLAHAARIGAKSTITGTRLQRFLDVAMTDKPFNIPLLYYGAHTGRFSGMDKLNLQNLPRGSVLREAIMAPPGHKIVAGDLSQIEARIVAVLAGERDLVNGFANDEDVYCEFASIIYDREITKQNPDERFVGKSCILSLGFGSGAYKFHTTMKGFGVDMGESEGQRIVDLYRATYNNIPRLWKRLNNLIPTIAHSEEMIKDVGGILFGQGRIELPNGMSIYYPALKHEQGEGWTYLKKGKMRTKIYGGALLENIAQALARIIISKAELRMAKYRVYACSQIHDELLFVVKDEHVDKVQRALTVALTAPVSWMPELPVACETAVGQTYKDAK